MFRNCYRLSATSATSSANSRLHRFSERILIKRALQLSRLFMDATALCTYQYIRSKYRENRIGESGQPYFNPIPTLISSSNLNLSSVSLTLRLEYNCISRLTIDTSKLSSLIRAHHNLYQLLWLYTFSKSINIHQHYSLPKAAPSKTDFSSIQLSLIL